MVEEIVELPVDEFDRKLGVLANINGFTITNHTSRKTNECMGIYLSKIYADTQTIIQFFFNDNKTNNELKLRLNRSYDTGLVGRLTGQEQTLSRSDFYQKENGIWINKGTVLTHSRFFNDPYFNRAYGQGSLEYRAFETLVEFAKRD